MEKAYAVCILYRGRGHVWRKRNAVCGMWRTHMRYVEEEAYVVCGQDRYAEEADMSALWSRQALDVCTNRGCIPCVHCFKKQANNTCGFKKQSILGSATSIVGSATSIVGSATSIVGS